MVKLARAASHGRFQLAIVPLGSPAPGADVHQLQVTPGRGRLHSKDSSALPKHRQQGLPGHVGQPRTTSFGTLSKSASTGPGPLEDPGCRGVAQDVALLLALPQESDRPARRASQWTEEMGRRRQPLEGPEAR